MKPWPQTFFPTMETRIAIFAIILFLLPSSSIVKANVLLARLLLPSPLTGPETLAFDPHGCGPYTGASDGRIFRFQGTDTGFVQFACTGLNRTARICNGIADFSALQATCGRPLGLAFDPRTGELYIADAYFGLMRVCSKGGSASQLVANIQGRPLQFTNALDIDPVTGVVYFTEASSNFCLRDIQALLSSTDSSGSLLRYDPTTHQTTVLLTGLAMASGVAVSNDGSFVLVSEFKANRIRRFWIRGPRANTSELFMLLAGSPDNIRRNPNGDFWVAVNGAFGLPPPPRTSYLPVAVRINEAAITVEIVSLSQGFGTEPVSDALEFNRTLYTGSLFAPFASVFTALSM